MKAQHVLALGASDPLPAQEGLPNGYAVLKDGATWVIRGSQWVRSLNQPSTLDPTDPDQPDPPPASAVGVPTEAELLTYAAAFGTMELADTSSYVPDTSPSITGFGMPPKPGGVPYAIVDVDDNLHIRRPGYYRVSLELIQGTVPTNVRGHVNFLPASGVQTTMELSHNQKAAFSSGVSYFATPDDDEEFGNGGGLTGTWLSCELPASAAAPEPPLVVRWRLTPIIFTGPAVMPSPLPSYGDFDGDLSGSGHLTITVQISGATDAQAMVMRVDDASGDTGFIGSWEDMSESGGIWSCTLDVPTDVGSGTHVVYISVTASNGTWTNGKSLKWGAINV